MTCCLYCKKDFEPKNDQHVYCSRNCSSYFRRELDLDASRAKAKKWREDNIDKARRYGREYNKRNADKIREYNAGRLERRNELHRKRYAEDPDYREKSRKMGDAHRWKFSENFTWEDLKRIRLEDCFYCGGPGGTADHLVPRSKGGEDRLDNLVPACQTCNTKKFNHDLQEFYARYPIA